MHVPADHPQVEAGAQCVLTQPPFDMAAFERWAADADKRGLLGCHSEEAPAPSESSYAGIAAPPPHGRVRLLVGAPMLTSAANLAFWLSLAGCLHRWVGAGVACPGSTMCAHARGERLLPALTWLCAVLGAAHALPVLPAPPRPACQELLRSFMALDASGGKQALEQRCDAYNRGLVQQVSSPSMRVHVPSRLPETRERLLPAFVDSQE